ncbi:pimeloyl-ACP methyl ester carboxylesterase [Micromonospora pisi]|uniref:Pimeloyl-ACP methyl ester carboxylesterase n=1 Tax=Micromonospora pisi TaxID=589240 RepID=A0A495JCH5_9ACTN|nr:alpha/beta hydrolase [Micromonospora pisi]RKR86617.1 pimeloyl-ACP methyl ester carboxylesterase [Micromonospora pisi]
MKNPLLRILAAATTAATIVAVLPISASVQVPAAAAAHSAEQSSATAAAKPPAGFTERKVVVGDIGINFVEGGHGKTLVLLHGYPQTWYEWHDILPELAQHYHVIAPDLRGAGGSDAPAAGYDKKTLADDVHKLLVTLHRDQDIRLVGHDIGTMVAYAYAAAHPQDVTRLVLTEAPIPDQTIYNFPALTSQGPGFWNFGFFNVTNGLPEQTVKGRETQWIERFTDMLEYNKDGVTPGDAAIYGYYLKQPGHTRASFEWFRTLNQDVADNAVNAKTKLTMPVLALGAQYSLGGSVPDQVRKYATNVTGDVVQDSGHWMWEEKPEEVTNRLLTFLNNS